MSCGNTGPFDGGTWNDPTIVRPTATGGVYTDGVFSGASLVGHVTVDAAVAQQLATFLCEYIKDCVELPSPVVASQIPGATEPTEEIDLPTVIIGRHRDQLVGRPDAWLEWGEYWIPAFLAK